MPMRAVFDHAPAARRDLLGALTFEVPHGRGSASRLPGQCLERIVAMTASKDIEAITDRIREREARREVYLDRIEARGSASRPIARVLSCGNLAHGFAACAPSDKATLAGDRCPTSASSPPTTTCCRRISPTRPIPHLIKEAAREAGGIAQVAGGVPAMCDGVTQGQPGMELSLFSRDVIAMATAIGALAQHVRRRRLSRRLRQDRARPGDRRADLRPSAGRLHPRRADDLGPAQRREGEGPPALCRRQGRPRRAARGRSRSPITAPAPAPSTAPPIPTRC